MAEPNQTQPSGLDFTRTTTLDNSIDPRQTMYERSAQRAAELTKAAQTPEYTWTQWTQDIWNDATLTAPLLREMQARETPDPDFRVSGRLEERMREAQKMGLPDAYMDVLGRADSDAEFDRLYGQAIDHKERQERLSATSNWTYWPAVFLANIISPADMAVNLTAYGAALKSARALRLGYLGQTANNAAWGGLSQAFTVKSLEALREPTSDEQLWMAIGLGTFLGGAFGPVANNPATAREGALLAELGRRIASTTGLEDRRALALNIERGLDELRRATPGGPSGSQIAADAMADGQIVIPRVSEPTALPRTAMPQVDYPPFVSAYDIKQQFPNEGDAVRAVAYIQALVREATRRGDDIVMWFDDRPVKVSFNGRALVDQNGNPIGSLLPMFGKGVRDGFEFRPKQAEPPRTMIRPQRTDAAGRANNDNFRPVGPRPATAVGRAANDDMAFAGPRTVDSAGNPVNDNLGFQGTPTTRAVRGAVNDNDPGAAISRAMDDVAAAARGEDVDPIPSVAQAIDAVTNPAPDAPAPKPTAQMVEELAQAPDAPVPDQVRQALADVQDPENPLTPLEGRRQLEGAEIDPAAMSNPRWVGDYMGGDGLQYRIVHQGDPSGPYNVLRRGTDGKMKVVAKDVDKLSDAVETIPDKVIDPAMLAIADKVQTPQFINPQRRHEVERLLENILPKGIRYVIVDADEVLRDPFTQQVVSGFYLDKVVHISMRSEDPLRTATEEAIHALRAIGAIAPHEWVRLKRYADQIGAKERYNIERDYGQLYRDRFKKNAAEKLDEEAVAKMAADYMTGTRFGGWIDQLFERLAQMFRSVREYFGGRNAQDILEDVLAGTVARRFEQKQATRRNVETHMRLYRGEPPDAEGGLGIHYTRSLERARGFAGPRGSVYYVDVPVDQMSRLGRGRGGEMNYTLPEDLQALRQPVESEAMLDASKPMADVDFQAVRDEDVGRGKWARFRFDWSSRFLRSDNAFLRLVGQNLLNESVGLVDAQGNAVKNAISADVRIDQFFLARMQEYNRYRVPALKEYAKEQGWSLRDTWAKAHLFYRDVGRYMTGDLPDASPAVKQLGDAMKKQFKVAYEYRKNPGRDYGRESAPLAGGEELQPNNDYFPRSYDLDTMMWAVDKTNPSRMSEGDLINIFHNAIKDEQPDLPPELSRKLAIGVVNSILRRAVGMDEWSLALSQGQYTRIERILKENLDGIASPEEITELVSRLRTRPKSEGNEYGNKRLQFNENVLTEVTLADGQVKRLGVKDFLDRDVDRIYSQYMRNLAGWVELANTQIRNPRTGELIKDGIRTDEDIDSLVRLSSEWAVMHLGRSRARVLNDKDAADLRFVFDRLLGRPDPEQFTSVASWFRRIRQFNNIRLLNSVGVAQFGEYGAPMGILGMKAVFSKFPIAKRIIENGRMRVSDQFLDEIENLGIGVNNLHSAHWYSSGDMGGSSGDGTFAPTTQNRIVDELDNALRFGQRVTWNISGMTPIQNAQEKQIAAGVMSWMARLAGKVRDGQKLDRGERIRLLQLGLDEEMLERIFKQFDYVTTEPSTYFPKGINRLNLNKWDDLEAAMAFKGALFRFTRKLIQSGDLGTMAQFMSNPYWGQFFHLRSFSFQAYSNQLLYNLNARDAATAQAFVYSMAFNGMLRALQVHFAASMRSDRDEYLEKNASMEALALASFQRAGFSSILPMGIDTLLMMAGQRGVFDARVSGQASDAIFGNTTFSLIDQVQRGVGGAIDSVIDGRDISQAEVRALAGLLPFLQTFPPLANALSFMIQELPERAPPKD